MTKNISPSINDIEDVLKEVYDPEFPLVDIFTLGLIYNIEVKKKNIYVLMTLTSPACPLGDMIVDMVKTAIDSKFPWYIVDVEIVFDPMWSPDFIKDDDLKKMFM